MQLSPVTLSPATCAFCNRTPEPSELFVDTLTFIRRGPVRDRAYVCRECGGKIAGALNWVDPKHYAELSANSDENYARAEAAEAELAQSKTDALAWVEKVVAEAKPAPVRKRTVVSE